jgi:hypothetical protein
MWQKLKDPFNIVTLCLAVVAIGLSIFFWLDGRETRSISYQIVDPISKIFDSKNTAPSIQMYMNDSIPITEDMWIITGKIWNSGKLPIDKTDVRMPITISINDSLRIADYKVTNQKDLEVADFTLDKLSNYELVVDWDYFDPGYGFEYQIIYIGNAEVNLYIHGRVLDVDNIKKIEYKQVPKENKDYVILFIITVSLLNVLGVFNSVIFIREGRTNSDKKLILVSAVSIIWNFISLIYIIYLVFDKFLIINAGPNL